MTASSERLSSFRATICSNKISKFRWVLILSFPNCVYTWLSIFLSLSPKSETDRKNSCLSTKLNVLCKHIHSVSTCQIQMKFYCFSHAIKKVFDHEFQSHSNPTDIAHLEIMFFAQPNLAISPPILWSDENGSHEYLTDFIHFGIWFIWSAAWIFQLKKKYKL